MDSIQILIKAILEKSSKQQLEQELKQLENKLKPVNIEVTTNSESQIKLYKSLQKIYQEEEKQRLIQEKASDKALADKEKILQYEQKVRKAIEDANIKEQQKTKELQEQIALFQKRMQLESSRITGKYDSLVDNKSLSALESDISGLSTSTPNATSRMKEFSLGMKEVELNAKNSSKAIKNTKQDSISFFQDISRSAFKFTEWYLLAGGITSVIDAIKNGVSYISQLDNSLNEIRIVTGKTQDEVLGLAESYNKLAKNMSVTTTEIASEAANLFRQGLNESEVEERMKAIIQYAKISSISLEQSDQIITATANATGESVQKIIDIFAMLGDSTASGADEIGEALQKVASAAENSGLSLEKSASWIATISSITRESASTIGRSINSIISRYEQIKSTGFNSEDTTKLNDVVKALSDIGIKATDTMGQLRPFAEVMDEVGAKFNSLSKNEQAYITTTMFGTFQRNKGLTLLRNYESSLQNYETAMNAAGTAEQKFNIYQESTQAKMDGLKASIEGFWQSAINSSFIKGSIDTLTDLVNVFGNLQSVLLLAGTALALWKGSALTSAIVGMKNFSLSTKLASSSMIEFRTISAAMQLQSMGLLTTTQMLTTSFKALGSAILTSFATNPIGWIAIGLTAYTSIVNSAKQKQDELNQSIKESASNAKDYTNNLTDLLNKYEQLNTLQVKDESSRQELKNVQEQIVKLLGMEKEGIDLVNDARGESIKKIREESLEKLKANQDSLRAALNLAKENSKKAQGEASNILGGGYEYYDFSPSDISKKSAKILQDANINGLQVSNRWITSDLEGAEKRIVSVQKAIDVLKNAGITEGEIYNQLVNSRDSYQKTIDAENNSLAELNKNLATQGVLQAQITLGTPTKDNYSDFKKSAVEAIAKQQGLNEVSDDFKKIIYEQIDKMYPALSGVVSKANEDLGNGAKSAKAYANELKKATEAYSEQTQKVQQLVAIRSELNSKEGLSAKSLEEITTKHQELLPYLEDETTLRLKLNETISQEEKVQRTAYANMLMVSETFYNEKIKGNVKLINEINDKYGIDLKNYKTLAEAKLAVENKLLGELAKKWSQFYDADSNSFTDAWNQKKKVMIATGDGARASVYQDQISAYGDMVQGIKNRFEGIVLDNAPVDFNKINLGDINKGKNKSQYNPSSEQKALKELLDANKITLEQYYSRLLALEKAQYSSYANKSASQLESMLRSKDEKVAKKTEEYLALKSDIANTGNNIFDKQFSGIQSAFDNDNNINKYISSLSNLKSALAKLGIKLTVEELDKLNDAIDKANLDKISLSFTKFDESLEPLNDKLAELEHSYKMLGDSDLAGKEKNLIEQLAVKNEKLVAINNEIIKYTQLMKSAKNDAISKMYKEKIDSLTQEQYQLEESMIERVNTARIDAISELRDAESKRHEDSMDNLDDELDRYTDYINEKIKALDKLHDAEDYERDINKKDANIQAKQNELNALALDNSAEAQARKAQLNTELLQLQEDKEETVRDHTRDQEKDLLNDLLDLKEKNISDQKKLEDDRYKAVQSNLDKMLTGTQDFYNKQDNISKMSIDKVIEYYQNLNKTANGVYDNLIAKLQQAQQMGMDNPLTPSSNLETLMPKYNDNQVVAFADYLNKNGHNVEWKNKAVYVDDKKMDMSGSNIKLAADQHYYGTIADIKKLLKKYGIEFNTGGYTGDWAGSDGKLAMLHQKEIVLNKFDTANLLKLVDITRSIIPTIKTFNPSALVNGMSKAVNIEKLETHVYVPDGINPEQIAEMASRKTFEKINTQLVLSGVK